MIITFKPHLTIRRGGEKSKENIHEISRAKFSAGPEYSLLECV